MNQIQRDRLLRVRHLMTNLNKSIFARDEGIGVLSRNAHFDIDTVARARIENQSVCPTVCCVIGAAAFDPVLNAQGLTYRLERRGDDWGDEWESADGTIPIYISLNGEPVHYDDPLLADFFGLSEENYLGLVSPAAYITTPNPDDVIERIDEYLSFYDPYLLVLEDAAP